MEWISRLIVLAAVALFAAPAAALEGLSDAQVVELVKNEKELLILDVRTEREFRRGHLEGSVHIHVNTLENRIAELEAWRDKKILALCEGGPRGEQAAMILDAKGFTKVYYAADGLMGVGDILGLVR